MRFRLVAAAIALLVAPAAAADLPIPPKGVSAIDARTAVRDLNARKKMSLKQFQDLLSAPIGKGRLE